MLSTSTRAHVPGLEWIDRLKGVAMLWVVLDHVVEQTAGGNLAGDPTGAWPALQTRVAQFQHGVTGFGAFDWPLTGLRDVGWLADQAVTIFIVLSGFGLALGLIAARANASLDLGHFYARRLRRIYPYWWGAHILFLPTGFLLASGLSTGDWQYYASFIGLRALPGVFYYFVGSWWYIGVLLQLYLVFPLLWWLMRTRGPVVLLAVTWSAGFLSLAFGHVIFHGDMVEMWQRGICAVTRLPEFAFGMALALWWTRAPAARAALLRRPAIRLAAAATYTIGFVSSFTLTGMIVAPTLLGIGAIVLLYPVAAWRANGHGPLEFVGRHSFTIYLTHQYIVELLVRPDFGRISVALGIVAALLVTTAATFVLESGTAAVERMSAHIAARRGGWAARVALGSAAFVIVALPIAAEAFVRAAAPEDATLPPERAALETDAAFGWRFIPSRSTELHAGGDYRLTVNADGFPGADLPPERDDAALRILVVGDAISSAGVDTQATWPQLLRRSLARLHRPARVADLVVTGYGPNQEALVARSYVPRFRPDVVLIQARADDVRYVLADTATLQRQVGLDRLPPDDFRSVLALERLRDLLYADVTRATVDRLHARPAGDGYRRGGFAYLERGHAEWDDAAVRSSAERYRAIAALAEASGARTYLVFLPAPAQICTPLELAYYPHDVALTDAVRFDRALPSARVRRIAALAHVPLWDLTPALHARLGCPYQSQNTYLRPEAQRAIADILVPELAGARVSHVPSKPMTPALGRLTVPK